SRTSHTPSSVQLWNREQLDRAGRVAGATGDQTDSWPAVASADPGQGRAVSSHAQGRGAGHARLPRSATRTGGLRRVPAGLQLSASARSIADERAGFALLRRETIVSVGVADGGVR